MNLQVTPFASTSPVNNLKDYTKKFPNEFHYQVQVSLDSDRVIVEFLLPNSSSKEASPLLLGCLNQSQFNPSKPFPWILSLTFQFFWGSMRYNSRNTSFNTKPSHHLSFQKNILSPIPTGIYKYGLNSSKKKLDDINTHLKCK